MSQFISVPDPKVLKCFRINLIELCSLSKINILSLYSINILCLQILIKQGSLNMMFLQIYHNMLLPWPYGIQLSCIINPFYIIIQLNLKLKAFTVLKLKKTYFLSVWTHSWTSWVNYNLHLSIDRYGIIAWHIHLYL
jgi:hypothetical protein